jgi:hypothetical protein
LRRQHGEGEGFAFKTGGVVSSCEKRLDFAAMFVTAQTAAALVRNFAIVAPRAAFVDIAFR